MKKIAHFKFEAPKIIGVISDRTVPSTVQRKFDSAVKRHGPGFVCLPFKVEPKYLKNVIACMRLMDIEGLIVIGAHIKKMARCVPQLHGSAKKAKRVNVIRRTKKKFHGYYVEHSKGFYKEAVRLLTSRQFS